MDDVVITWLFNSIPDPQRGTHIGADPAVLSTLADSVIAHGHQMVVLTDCLPDGDIGGVRFVNVPPGGNPYWYRWHATAAYLDAHREIGRAWAVDGTDVEMLHDPFPHMEPGRLYVGSEPFPLWGPAIDWLRSTGPSQMGWYAEHPHLPLLNLGLIGGDRADVWAITQGIANCQPLGDPLEMGVFQRLVYEMYPDRVTGPQVHTVFRAEERTAAWWKHK